jgi:hypothetical protein
MKPASPLDRMISSSIHGLPCLWTSIAPPCVLELKRETVYNTVYVIYRARCCSTCGLLVLWYLKARFLACIVLLERISLGISRCLEAGAAGLSAWPDAWCYIC